jgi:hypothetical protein
MASNKTSIVLTARDQQIHEALALTPLDTQQLLRMSETFDQPFVNDRTLRERMHEHTAAGWVQRFTYATTQTGKLNYYKLSPIGYRLLNGPAAPLPKASAFREVAPALQRHTRHLADIIVQTNVHARRLGVRILEQHGENQLPLTLGDRTQKPDHSFHISTRDGPMTFYDELDEGTEPIASSKQRESLEARIRFHEDYQNATGERYRVRVFFAKASARMVQFLALARRYAKQQRVIFLAVLLEDYMKHGSPLTSPMFVDHFNRLQSMMPASASRFQSRLPTFAEMLAEPAAVS